MLATCQLHVLQRDIATCQLCTGFYQIYFGCLKVEEGNELGSLGAVEELAEVVGEVERGRGGECGVPRKRLPTEKGFLIILWNQTKTDWSYLPAE